MAAEKPVLLNEFADERTSADPQLSFLTCGMRFVLPPPPPPPLSATPPSLSSPPSTVSSSSSSTSRKLVLFHTVTLSGYMLPSRSPSPSCPSHPHPHMYKDPSSDTKPLKLPAAATPMMFFLLSAVTSTGNICLDREPVPSCPNFPSPHAITTFSLVTSTQCAPPAATSSTGVPARAGTGRGVKHAARWPSPRQPCAPSPHTKTSPAQETPTQKPAWRTARFTPRGVKCRWFELRAPENTSGFMAGSHLPLFRALLAIPPHATVFIFGSPNTRWGNTRPLLSPCPSRPSHPSDPKLQTSPSLVTRTVCPV
mmetsp:Transcript_2630/g.8816  ORF Transcript_2630/g.8816 Transcript_2630/m.8816 type:complete len:310 (-) Transcript_2630:502-1431(-)